MYAPAFPPPRAPRRLILVSAFLLGLVVWLAPRTTPAGAQETKAPATVESPSIPAIPPIPPIPEPPASSSKGGIEIDISRNIAKEVDRAVQEAMEESKESVNAKDRTVTIKKGGKTVTVTGLPHDREFDSIGQLASMEPTLATMIVLIVAVIFLSPVFAIGLILAYRMRKAKMINETMLKLAEKGIVPPTEALDAINANNLAGVAAPSKTASAVAPIYAQAKAIRRRAAWSDLRKGVVMVAIGLGLECWSFLEDRTPNGFGLILLFVGIGYVVLWWFEERQFVPTGSDGGSGPGGPSAS